MFHGMLARRPQNWVGGASRLPPTAEKGCSPSRELLAIELHIGVPEPEARRRGTLGTGGDMESGYWCVARTRREVGVRGGAVCEVLLAEEGVDGREVGIGRMSSLM